MARGRWLVCITALVLLSGCGSVGNDLPADGLSAGPGGAGSGGDSLETLRRQAHDALARYDQAVERAGGVQRFVPVGELTGQVGHWDDHAKEAWDAGRLRAVQPLPAAPKPAGTVTWKDGATQTLPVMSAGEALKQIIAAGGEDCPACVPLKVTGARLTTAPVLTTRGEATAPAWEFTLEGTAARMTRVAVADRAIVKVTPPPWDPYNAPGGLAIESATTTTAGRRLTVTFTGAVHPASKPCGVDYTAETVESANAVVVILIEHPHRGDGRAVGDGAVEYACTAIGKTRTTTVDLARPLGSRAVLEVQAGLPVSTTVIR